MKRRLVLFMLLAAGMFLWPLTCPAPLVYRPGEGWTYESVGGKKWQRARAQDQYDVAQEAFDQKQYRLATKAARRTVKRWPLADVAPQAQYLVGRSYEARRMDERAFKEYQRAVEKYPKMDNFEEVLNRQFDIANRFLAGQWFKLWGYIPFFPSMEKTADMYFKIINSGPFSQVAPQAQMNIGAAREKQKEFILAARAYEKAADMYHDKRAVAADAVFKAALAYNKEARTAEYDQSVAGQAIATFSDFVILFPNDPRVAEAQNFIAALKTEQARGAVKTARFYEKKKQWNGALVYYNEAQLRDPDSTYAAEAKRRVEAIKRRLGPNPATAGAQP